MPTFEDGAFTIDKFRESYNANLANGLGNLVSRVMKMASMYGIKLDMKMVAKSEMYRDQYNKFIESFEIQKATDIVWDLIKKSDSLIEVNEPFKKIKIESEKESAEMTIKLLLANLYEIGYLLQPLMPGTSVRIMKAIADGEEIKVPLFPRL
jgi:methionyl-tRNA synthetase